MSRGDRGELRPPRNPMDFLKLAPELGDLVEFDFVPLMNKDSTNIIPDDWSEIAAAIAERISLGQYDGFVIAHGTDTMHFTASAVAFALGDSLNVPVVFTGAQTVPMVRHGDARINLLRAVNVALEDLAEVVISFGDYVFRAVRTQKKDERRFDAFESPSMFPIADITERVLVHPIAKRRKIIAKPISLRNSFAKNIVQIGLIPGLAPKLLEPLLNKSCNGLVLQSFGAGNVPDWGEYSFQHFISAATGMGIPTIITSQFPANSTVGSPYAPGLAALEAGAIPTGNMTSSAAIVKFRWVISQMDGHHEENANDSKILKVNDMMNTIFVDEMDAV